MITFGGGFHGRTYMTMALTGKVAPYKLGFGPFPGSVFHGQYPNALYGVTTEDAMNSLDRLFKADIDPKQVAAIVLEPVQGEGGFNVAPAEFMGAARAVRPAWHPADRRRSADRLRPYRQAVRHGALQR